jgi:hypothetical protein
VQVSILGADDKDSQNCLHVIVSDRGCEKPRQLNLLPSNVSTALPGIAKLLVAGKANVVQMIFNNIQ